MRKFTLLPIALIFCLFAVCLAPSAAALDDPEISARAALLADPETGRVYYSLNADERAYPASLTKVMTVLLAVEAVERGEVSQDDQVTASESAMEGMVEDGSTAGIVPGETMSFGDSGNDISMIEAAGVGVVMDNARDEIKAHADLIAPSNQDEGVAQIIEKYVLEGDKA